MRKFEILNRPSPWNSLGINLFTFNLTFSSKYRSPVVFIPRLFHAMMAAWPVCEPYALFHAWIIMLEQKVPSDEGKDFGILLLIAVYG